MSRTYKVVAYLERTLDIDAARAADAALVARHSLGPSDRLISITTANNDPAADEEPINAFDNTGRINVANRSATIRESRKGSGRFILALRENGGLVAELELRGLPMTVARLLPQIQREYQNGAISL